MFLLVTPKLAKLINHGRRPEPRHENLPGVDADRTMLASMVDLHDSITER